MLLRVKGVIHTAGDPRPLVIHGVQRMFHRRCGCDSWTRLPGTSIVVIGDKGARAGRRARSPRRLPTPPSRRRPACPPRSGDRVDASTSKEGDDHEDRLDRRRAHGRAHGGAAAQGRIRGFDLEPHPRQGRDRGAEGREGRRHAGPSSPTSTCSSPCYHRQGRHRRLLRAGRHVPRRPEADAEDAGRLLDHRHGRVGGSPRRGSTSSA